MPFPNILLTPSTFLHYRYQLLDHLSAHFPSLHYHLTYSVREPYRKPSRSLVHVIEGSLFRPLDQVAGDHPPYALVSTTGMTLTLEQWKEWEEWAQCERALREIFRRSFEPQMWDALGGMWSVEEIWEVLETEYMPSPIERQVRIVQYLRATRLPLDATQEEMCQLWNVFDALVIEAREAGLSFIESEVIDRFLVAIGEGELAEAVKKEYRDMPEWVNGCKRWRGVRKVIMMMSVYVEVIPMGEAQTLLASPPIPNPTSKANTQSIVSKKKSKKRPVLTESSGQNTSGATKKARCKAAVKSR